MFKPALIASTIFLFFSSPALANPPSVSLGSALTPYGKFGCIQRAKNKFFSLNATDIDVNKNSVWAFLDNNTIGVWCRGDEAIISVSGDSNASILKDEIKNVF